MGNLCCKSSEPDDVKPSHSTNDDQQKKANTLHQYNNQNFPKPSGNNADSTNKTTNTQVKSAKASNSRKIDDSDLNRACDGSLNDDTSQKNNKTNKGPNEKSTNDNSKINPRFDQKVNRQLTVSTNSKKDPLEQTIFIKKDKRTSNPTESSKPISKVNDVSDNDEGHTVSDPDFKKRDSTPTQKHEINSNDDLPSGGQYLNPKLLPGYSSPVNSSKSLDQTILIKKQRKQIDMKDDSLRNTLTNEKPNKPIDSTNDYELPFSDRFVSNKSDVSRNDTQTTDPRLNSVFIGRSKSPSDDSAYPEDSLLQTINIKRPKRPNNRDQSPSKINSTQIDPMESIKNFSPLLDD